MAYRAGSTSLRASSGSSLHRLSAFEAKLGDRRQLGATPGTHQHQTGAALQAKLRLRRIVLLALEALHTEAPLSRLRPRTRRLIGDSSPLTTASQEGEDDINRRLVRHTRSTNLPPLWRLRGGRQGRHLLRRGQRHFDQVVGKGRGTPKVGILSRI